VAESPELLDFAVILILTVAFVGFSGTVPYNVTVEGLN
jgi:hypothetical protein